VGTVTINQESALQKMLIVIIVGNYARVCMKQRLQKVHSIVNSPGYQGQDIYLYNDDSTEGPYNVLGNN
jgi:hypothetical protein